MGGALLKMNMKESRENSIRNRIEELLKDPDKLEEVFKEAIEKGDTYMADLLSLHSKSPGKLCLYAQKFMRLLDERQESIVAQSFWSSYYYARDVLKGPFPEGEDTIAKDPYASYFYAYDVLKDRFPKGEEKIIRKNMEIRHKYMRFLCRIYKLKEFLIDHPEVIDKDKDFINAIADYSEKEYGIRCVEPL